MNKIYLVIFALLCCGFNASTPGASTNKKPTFNASKSNNRTNKKFREKIGHVGKTNDLETFAKKLSLNNVASNSGRNETASEETNFKNNEVSTWKKQAKKYPKLYSPESGYYPEKQLVMHFDENGEEHELILLEPEENEQGTINHCGLTDLIGNITSLTPYQRYVTSPEIVWKDLVHVLTAFQDYWPTSAMCATEDEIDHKNALQMWRIYHIASKYDNYMRLVTSENSKQQKLRSKRNHVCKKKTGNHDLANEICQILRNIFFWRGKSEVTCVEAIVDNNVKWGPQLVALCRLEWPKKGLLKFASDPFLASVVDAQKRGPDVTLAILDGNLPYWYFIGAVHTEREPHRVKIVNELEYRRNETMVKQRFAPLLGTKFAEIMNDLSKPEQAMMVPREVGDSKVLAAHKILDWKMLGGKGDPFDPETGAFVEQLKTNEEMIKKKNEIYDLLRDKKIIKE